MSGKRPARLTKSGFGRAAGQRFGRICFKTRAIPTPAILIKQRAGAAALLSGHFEANDTAFVLIARPSS
jgi:hypothetical protein